VSFHAPLVTFAVTTIEELLLATCNAARVRAFARVRLFVPFEREQRCKCLTTFIAVELCGVTTTTAVGFKHRLTSYRARTRER